MSSESSPKLPSILKQARWIWPDSLHWDLHNCYALFRKTFDLSDLPTKAPLFITADQSYQLYVNGHYVCRGPARGFQKNWPYDLVDVRPWLKEGHNLIAIRAYNPGFSNFQYVHQGYAGLLVAAKWGQTVITSDDSWKCRRQAGVFKDTVPSSLQLYSQEVIDLRVEDPDWMLPDYDDSAWNGVVNATAWNAMPWYSLEFRGTAMLEEREIELADLRLIGQATGKSHPDYETTRDLALTRLKEGLAHKPASGDGEQLLFAATQKGKWRSQLVDLGKLHVGSVLLEIENAQGGEIVETHHYETIAPDNLCPDYDPNAHCRMAFSQRLTCRPGKNSHSFYHPFGFRYMVVTVRDNKAPLSIKPGLRTNFYPLQQNGSFNSSEALLNDIWQTCVWTQRVCSLDAYVDTPWREQAQWWGDARVQAWNTFHLDGDTRLFRRGIRQIASQTTPDGVTYGHAPTVAHGCILPDFTLIWMLTLWDYYWQTGSLEPFLEHQPQIKKALDYFKDWLSPKNGLLQYDHRFWLFLDWTGLLKEGCSSVYSLWFLHALDRLSQMYTASDLPEEAGECAKLATPLRKSLLKLINDDGLMRDGYTPKGKIAPETSVHAQTLAILTGLCPENEKVMLEKRLVPYVRGELQTDIQPSAYWITYIYTVLAERGYGEDVVADIHKRWAPMVKHGTTWENFEPVKAHESFSHAWSAHPLFHLMQIAGGVRQAAPGWTEITYKPDFIGDSAEVVIPSPKGKITSAWKRSGKTIQGQIKLPKGINASVQLPDSKPIEISGTYSYEVPFGH